MEKIKEWSDVVFSFFDEMLRRVGGFLPNLIGAIFVLVVGLIVAKILRKLTVKLLNLIGIEAVSEKTNFSQFLKKIGFEKGIGEILASVIYFMVIIIFLVSASEILGIKVVLETLNRFVVYLPHVFGAFLILLITFFIAKFVKDALSAILLNLKVGFSQQLASIVEILIITFGIVIALRELGFDTTIFTANITLIIGGIVFALALSLGLGGKNIMANILSKYYINQYYNVGDEVIFAGNKGKIIEITNISVIIQKSDGEKLTIPHEMIVQKGSLNDKE